MQNLFADLRYALRQFRLSPVFTATAVLTLALGIGGTTAIFSLIHAVMLRSLPVADPATLYRIGDGNDCCVEGGPQGRWGMYSVGFYRQLEKTLPEFERLAAFQAGLWQFSVRRPTVDRVPKPLRGEFVTGNYFSTFGIPAFTGHLFSAADDNAGSAPVAVLSYRVWQGAYGGDPSIVGSSLVIGGHPFTVSGIAPPGFFGETLRSDPPDLWLPLEQEPLINGKASLLRQPMESWLRVIGRLRSGATVTGMSARLTSQLRQWLMNDAGFPAAWIPALKRLLPKQYINVVPAGTGVAAMKEEYGRSLNILLTVCCLVLLIACANVANLLLARSLARRSQTSLRLALGASRRRIMSQSLAESVLLALAGGALGLFIADAAGRLLLALVFHGARFIPISTRPSLPVLLFAFGVSLLTGIVFGTAPAWFATRSDPVEALRGVNRSTGDRSSFSRSVLLIVQATLAVVLIAGAAMLTRSLGNLEHQNLGIETEHRISVQLNPPPASYTPERLNAVYRELEDRLKRLPGIEREGLALYNPFTDNWGELIFVAGHPAPPMSENGGASWDRVSPGYFETVGQPVLRGRGFTEADTAQTAPIAVVNQAFVRRFLPKEDPLDKHFGIDLAANAGIFQIVGVVRDAKYTDPERPARPMFFVPLAQYVPYKQDLFEQIERRSHFIGGLLLESRLSPGALEPVLRRTLASVDDNLTINDIRTMQEQVDLNFDQQRAVASLASLFGIIALALAAVGLYGVTAYTVAQRTSEIGVRMALGADKPNVVRLVLRGAFQKVAIGLALGIPLAVGAGRLISAQLYGVVSWDPVALSIAIASLALCAFLASIIPAGRAASIDPMKALRTE